ncbi:MAG: hypothetical protein K4304_09320 [Propionicimonas sp.]
MNWVLLFGAIALGGLIMLVSYAVWLGHKAADLFSELEMLGQRVAELADLLGQIRPVVPAELEDARRDA